VPPVTAVPGAPRELLGVGLYEGNVVPVLAVGSAASAMVVCQHAGELVGLVGLEVVGPGTFEAEERGVRIDTGERVESLDVAALYARVQHNTGRARSEPLRDP
jgi:hypothetical protein